VRFVLGTEMLQRRQGWRRSRIAKGAQRLARDQIRDILEQGKVLEFSLPALDLGEDVHQPLGALAARRALAARLVSIETQQVFRHPYHAGRFIEHDDAGRA
jgi:hypothetical protein